MAQVIFPLNGVTPLLLPGSMNGVSVVDGAHIYESAASPIGVGANSPYVAAFMKTLGGEDAETIANKIIELFVNYTDGSRVSLGRTATGGSAFPEPFTSAEQWRVFRADGTMRVVANPPTAATAVAQNAMASARERLPLDASKTVSFLRLWVSP